MNIEKLKKRLWEESKPAEEIHVNWISIPTLDAIGIIEELQKELNDLQGAYDIAMKEISKLRKLLGYDSPKP